MVFGTAVVRSLLRSVSAHKSASYVLAANRYAIGASKVNHVACCTPRRMFSTEDYKESIQKRVLGVCENFEKLKDAKISLSSNFTNDLGLDSLDFVELIMAVEDEFGMRLLRCYILNFYLLVI